jgi:D-alanyl-D-alanine-carboxypeptidase/D-alanyl-D-alanine-endopeptidase
MVAAGGVRSTAADVLCWLEACLRPGDDPPGPALALAQRPHARAGRRPELGLGWIIGPARPRRPTVIWHNGLTYGFRSFGAFVPDAGVAVVALANTTRPLERLGLGLIDVGLAA